MTTPDPGHPRPVHGPTDKETYGPRGTPAIGNRSGRTTSRVTTVSLWWSVEGSVAVRPPGVGVGTVSFCFLRGAGVRCLRGQVPVDIRWSVRSHPKKVLHGTRTRLVDIGVEGVCYTDGPSIHSGLTHRSSTLGLSQDRDWSVTSGGRDRESTNCPA